MGNIKRKLSLGRETLRRVSVPSLAHLLRSPRLGEIQGGDLIQRIAETLRNLSRRYTVDIPVYCLLTDPPTFCLGCP